MKKETTAVITLTEDEALKILTPTLRKHPMMKDIPTHAEVRLFEATELSVEYSWEDEQ